MKILTYLSALILSAFIYLLFGAYMTVSAGLESAMPLVSFYCALLTFGFFSWFHFYYPRLGAILLTVAVGTMFLTWPMFLLVDFFDGDYRPSVIEFGIPMLLSLLTVFSALKARRHSNINRYLAASLAIPPLLLTLYLGGYFTLRMFG